VLDAFKENLAEQWAKVRNKRLLRVEEEWKRFKETVIIISARVCGYTSVCRKNERSVWWTMR